jgi:3-deoxy-7-phosphoheptulonate synthase
VLPSPNALRTQLPLPPSLRDRITTFRVQAKEILQKKREQLVLILGPCSIHHWNAALEYAQKLHALSQEVQDRFFLVMRTYVEKSRTGNDWKGFLYDPHLAGEPDIITGLHWTRKLLIELASLGIPTAIEFVNPLAALYYEDLVTWGFIGARTCCSQLHRQFTSSLSFPVGIKNDLQGNIVHAVQGVNVAKAPQIFPFPNEDGHLRLLHSTGNPYAHIVLRGSERTTNYTPQEIQKALLLLKDAKLPPHLMIDCSHGNSQKKPQNQQETFHSVLAEIKEYPIFGLMLESYFTEGSQEVSPNANPYLSVTDSCLDWNMTEEMVLNSLTQIH